MTEEEKTYIQKIHANLVKVYKDKVPSLSDFEAKMQDKGYQEKIHANLAKAYKDKVPSEEDFYGKVEADLLKKKEQSDSFSGEGSTATQEGGDSAQQSTSSNNEGLDPYQQYTKQRAEEAEKRKAGTAKVSFDVKYEGTPQEKFQEQLAPNKLQSPQSIEEERLAEKQKRIEEVSDFQVKKLDEYKSDVNKKIANNPEVKAITEEYYNKYLEIYNELPEAEKQNQGTIDRLNIDADREIKSDPRFIKIQEDVLKQTQSKYQEDVSNYTKNVYGIDKAEMAKANVAELMKQEDKTASYEERQAFAERVKRAAQEAEKAEVESKDAILSDQFQYKIDGVSVKPSEYYGMLTSVEGTNLLDEQGEYKGFETTDPEAAKLQKEQQENYKKETLRNKFELGTVRLTRWMGNLPYLIQETGFEAASAVENLVGAEGMSKVSNAYAEVARQSMREDWDYFDKLEKEKESKFIKDYDIIDLVKNGEIKEALFEGLLVGAESLPLTLTAALTMPIGAPAGLGVMALAVASGERKDFMKEKETLQAEADRLRAEGKEDEAKEVESMISSDEAALGYSYGLGALEAGSELIKFNVAKGQLQNLVKTAARVAKSIGDKGAAKVNKELFLNELTQQGIKLTQDAGFDALGEGVAGFGESVLKDAAKGIDIDIDKALINAGNGALASLPMSGGGATPGLVAATGAYAYNSLKVARQDALINKITNEFKTASPERKVELFKLAQDVADERYEDAQVAMEFHKEATKEEKIELSGIQSKINNLQTLQGEKGELDVVDASIKDLEKKKGEILKGIEGRLEEKKVAEAEKIQKETDALVDVALKRVDKNSKEQLSLDEVEKIYEELGEEANNVLPISKLRHMNQSQIYDYLVSKRSSAPPKKYKEAEIKETPKADVATQKKTEAPKEKTESVEENKSDKAKTEELKEKHRKNTEINSVGIKYSDIIGVAENAEKAVANVMPDTKIVFIESSKEFKARFGKDGRGFADGKTIYVNLEKANLRTIPHELVHLMMFNKFGGEKQVQAAAKDIVASVKKELANGKMSKALEKFVSMYEQEGEGIMNEEYVSELVGYLTEGFDNFSVNLKTKIKDFINTILKKLGLKEIPSSELRPFLKELTESIKLGKELTREQVDFGKFTKTEKGKTERVGREQIDAWHGSKKEFDKFDSSMIGTGVGVGRTGWGFYFTLNENRAKGYAKELSKSEIKIGDSVFKKGNIFSVNMYNDIEKILSESKGSRLYVVKELLKISEDKRNKEIENERVYRDKYATEEEKKNDDYDYPLWTETDYYKYRKLAKDVLKDGVEKKDYPAYLYGVVIKENGNWLDFDKEVPSKQYEQILNQAKKEGSRFTKAIEERKGKNGKELYFGVTNNFNNSPEKEMSLLMMRAGIDGNIGRHDNDTEYVVFDENAVSIDKVERFQKTFGSLDDKSKKELKILSSKIDGGFLNKKRAEELQKEIESNYDITPKFGQDSNDIRKSLYNYDNPYAEKDINGVNLRITQGLIEGEPYSGNRRKTWLLYADGKIVGKFNSVEDAKRIVDFISDNLINEKKIERFQKSEVEKLTKEVNDLKAAKEKLKDKLKEVRTKRDEKLRNLASTLKGRVEDFKSKSRELDNYKKEVLDYVNAYIKDNKLNTYVSDEFKRALNTFSKATTQFEIDKAYEKVKRIIDKSSKRSFVSEAKKLISKAKSGYKRNMGQIPKGIKEKIDSMLSIHPELIEESEVKDYLTALYELANPTMRLEDITEIVDRVLESFDEKQELIPAFVELYESIYGNDVSNFAENLKEMKDENFMADKGGVISEQLYQVAKANASAIKKELKEVQEAEDLSEQEIAMLEAEVEETIMQKVEALNPEEEIVQGLDTEEKRKIVGQLFDNVKRSVTTKMNLKKLRELEKAIDLATLGYVSNRTYRAAKEVTVINNANQVLAAPVKVYRDVWERLTSLWDEFKFTNTAGETITGGKLKKVPLFSADSFVKNFESTVLYQKLIRPTAAGYGDFLVFAREVDNEFDKNLNKFKKVSKLEQGKANIRVKMFEIDREYRANPNNPKIFSVKDFVEAAISYESDFSDFYKQTIKEVYEANLNADKVFEIKESNLSELEKAILKSTNAVYEKIKGMAEYNEKITRGNDIIMYEGYTHRIVKGSVKPMESLDQSHNNVNTRAGAQKGRVSKVVPVIYFDAIASAASAAREVGLDYYVSQPMQESVATFKMVKKDIAGDKDRREVFSAIESAFEEMKRNNLTRNLAMTTSIEKLDTYLQKIGNMALMAGTQKVIAEAVSNYGFALIADDKALMRGFEIQSSKGVDGITMDLALKKLGITQVERIVSDKGTIGTVDVLTDFMVKGSKARPEDISPEYFDSILKIKDKLGDAFIWGDSINNALVGLTDRSVSRTLIIGKVANEFKKITGEELDFEKLANDEKYRVKHRKDLYEAKIVAERLVQDISGTRNPMEGIAKHQREMSPSTLENFMRYVQAFMNPFAVYEYTTFRKAARSLVQNILEAERENILTKEEAIRLMMATVTRFYLYSRIRLLVLEGLKGLAGLIPAFSGLVDNDEEDRDFEGILRDEGQYLLRNLIGTTTTLALGKSKGAVTKSVIFSMLEYMNENYGEGVTYNGKYDYTKSIFFQKLKHPETMYDVLGLIEKNTGYYGVAFGYAVALNELRHEAFSDDKDVSLERIIYTALYTASMAGVPFNKDVKNIADAVKWEIPKGKKKKGLSLGGTKLGL